MIDKYGADSLRLYLVSNSSPDKDFDWNDREIQGSFRFVKRVYEYFSKLKKGKTGPRIESKLNSTIQKVTDYIENFKHNLAVIEIRELFNRIAEDKIDKKTAETFLKLLHIYCPFITEELWHKLGNKSFISLEKWTKLDLKKINKKFEEEERAVERVIGDINHISRLVDKKSKKAFVYVLPKEKDIYVENLDSIKGRIGLEIEVFSVNDKKKYDPENKAKKAKPGRPGIYLE